MADERPVSTDRLPTLTEVVELGDAVAPAIAAHASEAAAAGPPLREGAAMSDAIAAAMPQMPNEAALVEQVLIALAPRIDMLFEARLREAVAPALARVADGLIRDTRDELASVLRDLVDDAVSRMLERRDRDTA